MSKSKEPLPFRAKPISHWQYATLMDVRSGRARRRARQAKTTTLALLNAQTLSSLLYRGYVDCDASGEPWVTELGETVVAYMTGEGRYRNAAGEITARVQAYVATRRRSGPHLASTRNRKAA